MSLGDVLLVLGLLAAHGVALPGLSVTWSLLCPRIVARSRERLARGPGRSFLVGLGATAAAALLVPVGFGLGPLPGFFVLGLVLALASVGGAGLAALLGERLRAEGVAATPTGALLRGAVALELAVAVPLVGWFVILPLGTVAMLGAATLALVRPGRRASSPPPLVWPTPEPRIPHADQLTPPLPVRMPAPPTTWAETGVGHAPHPS